MASRRRQTGRYLRRLDHTGNSEASTELVTNEGDGDEGIEN
jgi:hypothetical protein